MTLEKSLPSEYYLSEEIFGRERERIFSREWFCAGRADTLPPPGELRVLDLLGESILVARTREGKLVAHYNVCRHRGARLCTGDAATPTIRCPYHAWTYGLDGKLLGAPFLNQDPVPAPGGLFALPGRDPALGRLLLSQPLAGRAGRAQLPGRARAHPGASRPVSSGFPRDGPEHLLRRRRELEGRRRELQRVLPLRRRPPGAVRGRPGVQGRRGSGARLGARHSAPRRRLHVHEERDHHARALRRPLGGRKGPAQGRARLSESLPLALARPRRGVSSHARRPGPHPRRLRLPLRPRRDGPPGLRPVRRRGLLGRDQPAGLGDLRAGPAGDGLAGAQVRVLRADGGPEPGHPPVRSRAAGRDAYFVSIPALTRSSRYP